MLAIHVCDDWLSCRLSALDAVHTACSTISRYDIWLEVVAGLDSIAVQFDPSQVTPGAAEEMLREQLLNLPAEKVTRPTAITIPVCYDADLAPDRDWIAEKLGLSAEALMEWHSNLKFTVTMLGFMPGFAYLQCAEPVPHIGRLSKPRQNVEAGSIGLIGDQSCIYSFSSPGGWPIIGRTPARLFDPEKLKPALLSANQMVAFQVISRSEFDTVAKEQGQ